MNFRRMLAATALTGVAAIAAAAPSDRAPAIFDAIRARDVALVRELAQSHPDALSAQNRLGATPLMAAAYAEHADRVVAIRAAKNELTFHEACIVGDLRTLRAQVARGQPVDQRSADGYSPLGLAVFFGRAEAARFLLDAGADVNAAASALLRVSPIHAAVARGDLGMLTTLLLRGADPNQPQQQLVRPLHEAAAANNVPAVAMLLMFGAQVVPVSEDGHTPARLARARGHHELADRLDWIGKQRQTLAAQRAPQ